jgi:mono/diheme cytochrome c family protein
MRVGMSRERIVLWIVAMGLLAGPFPLAAQTPQLAGRELAGKKLFLQRCSICHLPPLNEPDNPDPQPYGPKLNGFVRNTETEERARRAILTGTPRMPGFQYGLTKEEVETILTYLKVFK